MTSKKISNADGFQNILLSSSGLYPQVITEVIYALNQAPHSTVLDEIHVITTQVGMKQIKSQLLDKENGQFFKLCEEYNLNDTSFELRNVQLLKNATDAVLEDILTVGDNEIVANAITETVRKLTSDPNTALHVSLAGGRRTISYYLGYALSLFGRPQDRLYHVVVTREFESDDEFFYPNTSPTYITDRTGKKLNTQDADVQLADIPFVRLREGLPHDLLDGKSTFVQAVSSILQYMPTPHLEITLNNRSLKINQQAVVLSPVLYAWYTWLSDRINKWGRIKGAISIETDASEFLLHIQYIFGQDHIAYSRASSALTEGFSIDYISEKNSLINKKLKLAFNHLSASYLIKATGKRPKTQYSLELDPSHIQFV